MNWRIIEEETSEFQIIIGETRENKKRRLGLEQMLKQKPV